MKSLLLSALALSTALIAGAGETAPKREFRSTWFTTHVNIDWPMTKGNSASVIAKQKQTLLDYLDGFEKMHLNGICFHVRAQCDATYRSSYEPWSAVMTGTRGKDPGWDPLAYAVEECHKRGLECYAWINPYRWSTGTDYKTAQDLEFKNKGWILSYGNYYVLNPALPEVREHILKVCKEIVDNYDIDGVLFDDYFYPNNIPENSSAGDWDDYKASGTTMSIGDWRRENVNMFVRQFRDMIETEHPDMRFGISPAGVAGASAAKFGVKPSPVNSDWQYATIYSDPLAWLHDGSIDFISPQIYWTTDHATAPYKPLCEWWSYVADHFGRHFYSSQEVYKFTSTNSKSDWAERANQVKLNRQYDTQSAPGSIYFSSKYFYGPALTGLGDYLLENVYQTQALVPVVPWKKVPTFGAPADLKFDGTKLTWTAIDAPRSIMRYTVYAVPRNVSIDDASEANGDGLSSDYLLKVSYSPEFTVPADRRTGYWYAVCAYDGAGNEFEPAVVNYADGVSQKVTLNTPANGAKVDWKTKFGWSAVSGAEYVLRIAADANFSDVVYTSERVNVNTLTVAMDDMKPSTTYYWGVQCFEPGKLRSTSDSRSFVTPANTDAPATTLVTPADGASIDESETFSWTAVNGVATYTLEIASDADFKNLRLQREFGAGVTSTVINASLIGKGHFFWRVTTAGTHLNPTVSASRTFTVDNITIGATEPGYTVKKDPASYPKVQNVTVENLWMRSTKSGFGNISFENNGSQERSMVAVGDYVYLTHRSENSEGANIMLEKYDGFTGEHVSTIALADDAKLSYFPINTVTKDDADNVIVSNMVLNAMTSPLVLHRVNLLDGTLDEVAEITLSGLPSARVDHVAVTGDVAKGNFKVYIAVASTDRLVRVTYVNGRQTEIKTKAVSSFSPSSCSTFGVAPFVTPVSHDEMLVNGGGTTMARFNIATGRMVDSFANNSEVGVTATMANGSEAFELGNVKYTVFASADHSGSNGIRFDILRSEDDNFSSMRRIATVPESGLGWTNSTTASTPVSAVRDNDGTARVYVYAVGNGISAYRISDPSSSVAKIETPADGDITVSVIGGEVVLSRPAAQLDVYTATGALVASARGIDRLALPGHGVFIVVADGNVTRVAL